MDKLESDKLMEKVTMIVTQYNEGAITSPEAFFAIVNHYVENQETIVADDKKIQKAMDEMKW